LATSVFEACERLGIEVPGELEIVTVNEWPSLMLRRPWDAHRIVRRKYEIGVEAARRLKASIDRQAADPEVVRIPAELYVADLNAMSQFYQMTSMDQ
jgi:DNA-binding LacI/PurR family transcriptional regulator